MEEREYQREKPADAGSPPKTDTDTRPGVAKPKAQAFELMPREVGKELRTGDLDFHEFGVLSFLLVDMDWQTKEWRGTLGLLKESIGWTHSDEYLRQTLSGLQDKEWIAYPMRPGQRGYVITYGERYYEALNLPTSNKAPTQTPPSSWTFAPTGEVIEGASSPHVDGQSERLKAPTPSPPYTETETETETRLVIEERGKGESP